MLNKKNITTFIKADADVAALKARLKLAEAKRAEAEAAIIDSLNKAVQAGEAVEVAREAGKDGTTVTVTAHGYIVNLCRFRKWSFSSAKLEKLHPGAYEASKEWGKPQSSLTVRPE
jgi:hypothetical protein